MIFLKNLFRIFGLSLTPTMASGLEEIIALEILTKNFKRTPNQFEMEKSMKEVSSMINIS